MNKEVLDQYNKNAYLKTIELLLNKIQEVKSFLGAIGTSGAFKDLDGLLGFYNSLFENDKIKQFIHYKISQVENPYYLRFNEEFTKGNSNYHINLKIDTDVFLELDEIYQYKLSRLLKPYKHLFTRINNFFIQHTDKQESKYKSFIEELTSEIEKVINFERFREVLETREKLDPQLLNKLPFEGLRYICHIENLNGILDLGILSHNEARKQGVLKQDISISEVNERRNRHVKELGGNIHDFTPLYINHKNPMLYTLCKNKSKSDLILLKINPHILLSPDVYFTDGNAAVSSTHFYNDINDFNKLGWNLIQKGRWYDYELGIREGRRIMCSEVLTKGKIPVPYIDSIILPDETHLPVILQMFPNHLGIKIQISPSMFF